MNIDDILELGNYYLANDLLNSDMPSKYQKMIIEDFLENEDVKHLCNNIYRPYFEDRDCLFWMVPELLTVFLVWLEPDLVEVFNDVFEEASTYKAIISEMLLSLNDKGDLK